MPGDAQREAERPPWFRSDRHDHPRAPLFAGSVIVLGPYLLSGWKLDAPFFSWAPSRWIGVALVILPIPPRLDFLLRFDDEVGSHRDDPNDGARDTDLGARKHSDWCIGTAALGHRCARQGGTAAGSKLTDGRKSRAGAVATLGHKSP
jgi:hypothetical protein